MSIIQKMKMFAFFTHRVSVKTSPVWLRSSALFGANWHQSKSLFMFAVAELERRDQIDTVHLCGMSCRECRILNQVHILEPHPFINEA